jgi:2-polyprenyl-3-methyl-5-hydroxy-6-metoxy-1,4-benzoquinol methylase
MFPNLFTLERYGQFNRFLPVGAKSILDAGANTGRGGQRLAELNPLYELTALDCVQSRLDALPKCYLGAICGLSNAIPADDQSFDAIVAGEFLEHLYPSASIRHCVSSSASLRSEAVTTPNPAYI